MKKATIAAGVAIVGIGAAAIWFAPGRASQPLSEDDKKFRRMYEEQTVLGKVTAHVFALWSPGYARMIRAARA